MGGLGVRATTVLRLGRPVVGVVPAPSPFLLSVSPGTAQDEPMSDSFTRHLPDSMLRSPSRFTDSSAPAETSPAASGRCGRRVCAADVAQTPGLCVYTGSHFLRARRCVRYAEAFRHRPYSLFVLSFCTVFPSSSPHTTPAVTGGESGREAVLSLFRKGGSRFRGSNCKSGKCAALAGFREGGRKGKPVPPLSLFTNILFSDRQCNVGKRYRQFKNRPSDRRHAYF